MNNVYFDMKVETENKREREKTVELREGKK